MAPVGDPSRSASLADLTTTLATATARITPPALTTTLSPKPPMRLPDLGVDEHLSDPSDSQLSIRLVGDKGQYHSLTDWHKFSNPSNFGDNLENQTFSVPIQTSFRLADYSLYDQETEQHAEHGIKQNQMLPIYCSIMGLIILFLLCYVVYKLWKQREAMTTAKLTEVYTSSGSSGKGDLGSHRRLSDSASRFAPTSNQSPQSFKTSNHQGSKQSHSHMNYETEPLLGNLNGINGTNGYTDQPLSAVPLNIQGLLCYRLSQQGWRELASTLGVEIPIATTPLDQPCSCPDLLKACLDVKQSTDPRTNTDDSKSNQLDDLRQTVNLFHEISKQNRLSVSGFCYCLRKINRPDLVPLFQTIITDLNPNKPTDLGSTNQV